MDNPEKPDTVTEIHIKGWRIEKSLLEVLTTCFPALDQLTTLKFVLLKGPSSTVWFHMTFFLCFLS
jgi:hypothetical protein